MKGLFPLRRKKEIPHPERLRRASEGYGGENPVNELRSLEEALEAIADSPPTVARSTPKNYRKEPIVTPNRDASDVAAPATCDKLLAASLDACARLQADLDAVIVDIRSAPGSVAAPSPVPPHVPLSVHTPAGLPPSDSGQGTSLDGNESLSPVPAFATGLANGVNNNGGGSPTKSVSFKDLPTEFGAQEPKPLPPHKRRVIRMMDF